MSKANGKLTEAEEKKEVEHKECFVIMPFRDYDGYETGHYRRVFDDLIKPACERASLVAIREDDGSATNMIHLSMLQKIVDKPIALCDLSNLNPNVLYELGIRQAFDKPTVIIKDNNTPNIFDLSPIRYVNYKRELKYRDVLDEQNKIAEALEETMEAYKNGKGINSLVRLLFLSKAAETPKSTIEEVNQAMLQTILYELKNFKENFGTSIPFSTQMPLLSESADLDNEVLKFNHYSLILTRTIDKQGSPFKIQQYYEKAIKQGETLIQLYHSNSSKQRINQKLNDLIKTYQNYLREKNID